MPASATGILVAGGSSTRMGFDKLWADLCGRPLLAWPLLAFERCRAIDQVVLVVAAEARQRAATLLGELQIDARIVLGGARRRDSVMAGLEASTGEWVVIHDAARPILSEELIELGLAAAGETGAAIAAVPETNTVKRVTAGRIEATLDRSVLWAAQTPQVFRRDVLLEAHRRSDEDATDDAGLVELTGVTVKIYEGAYANIKVTTPVDLQLAALLLSQGVRGAPSP